ncbi:unnamed protein product [Nippostrongylus brasiliensis]|uniref:Transcriptional regulator n=1 Tax=Nippostrongylus brasiliensis TaxID=27835 RepID=A0A0N4XLV8_NIPBR|nr:unnamed protein product [Nippostrongylus brasiliensis]
MASNGLQPLIVDRSSTSSASEEVSGELTSADYAMACESHRLVLVECLQKEGYSTIP